MMVDFLKSAGLTSADVGLRINSRKVLNAVVRGAGIPDEGFAATCVIIDKLGKIGAEQVKQELEEKVKVPSHIGDRIVRATEAKTLEQFAELAGVGDCEEVAELRKLFDLTKEYGIGDWVEFDASVVRGLSYYTGVVFEGFDRAGALRAICGGGRYDRLLTLYGSPKEVPCAGFGFGDCVIAELLKEKKIMPTLPTKVDFVVAAYSLDFQGKALNVAARLRGAGFTVDFYPDAAKKVAKAFNYADRVGADKVAFVAPAEWERGVVRVKDLRGFAQDVSDTEKQRDVPLDDLANINRYFDQGAVALNSVRLALGPNGGADPAARPVLTLDGKSLTPDELMRVFVARPHGASQAGETSPSLCPSEMGTCAQVEVSDEAWRRVRRAREVVEEKLAKGGLVYGVNTGFGALRNVTLAPEQLSELQVNLIRSHAAGVGEPMELSRVKRMLTVRCNVISKGHSGVREVTLQRLLTMLNADLLPYIPERGSVGCSGDLAPSAHMVLGLMGEGLLWNPSTRSFQPGADVLAEHCVEAVTLEAKEGLALINGTQGMATVLAETVVRAGLIAKQADLVAACTLEALRAASDAFLPEVHEVRGHRGQAESAARIRGVLHTAEDPSELMTKSVHNIQDAYSLRCIPQVHGVVHDTVAFVYDLCTRELNAATDNPLVFADGRLVSAGNFHGEYPAKAADFLAIGVSELACIAERRIERMLNPSLSGPTVKVEASAAPECNGKPSHIDYNIIGEQHTFALPAFLLPTGGAGLSSGFMIPHCTAAALVNENKVLCHPASVDSISTSAAQEDHVAMGMCAALKGLRVVENVERCVGIELMAACQALDLTGLRSTQKVENIKSLVRSRVKFWECDQVAYTDMQACFELLRQGKVVAASCRTTGP